jgi:hypothetical protein
VQLTDEAKILLMVLNDGDTKGTFKMSTWRGDVTPYYTLASKGQKSVIKTAVTNISFFNSFSGRHINVSNIEKTSPVKVQLRALSDSTGSDSCVVWDENESVWVYDSGVSRSVSQPSKGYIVCDTTHFSSFTVIVKDVVKYFYPR